MPFADDPEDEVDLVAYFYDFIYSDGEHGGPLLEAFDLEVSNSRAEIEIQYTFTWSAFFSCDDMNKTDQNHGVVAGVKKDGKWLFERSEPRSTFDEF